MRKREKGTGTLPDVRTPLSLDEWVSRTCPDLSDAIRTHVRCVTDVEVLVRCIMIFVRGEFDK